MDIYYRLGSMISRNNKWCHLSDVNEIVTKIRTALESKIELAKSLPRKVVLREVRDIVRLMLQTKRAELDLQCLKGTIATWEGMKNARNVR